MRDPVYGRKVWEREADQKGQKDGAIEEPGMRLSVRRTCDRGNSSEETRNETDTVIGG